MAIKYFEHFLYIAHAMTNMDGAGIDLWDAEDEFFYDVILLPTRAEHSAARFIRWSGWCRCSPCWPRLRPPRPTGSTVFVERAKWFVEHRPDLLQERRPGRHAGRRQLAS